MDDPSAQQGQGRLSTADCRMRARIGDADRVFKPPTSLTIMLAFEPSLSLPVTYRRVYCVNIGCDVPSVGLRSGAWDFFRNCSSLNTAEALSDWDSAFRRRLDGKIGSR